MQANDFLNQLKEAIKLSSIIERYTKVFKKGNSIKALCPFHQEKTPSFGIDDSRGLFHCFGCHESGDHFSFIQKIHNLDFKESVNFLSDLTGIKKPESYFLKPNKNARLYDALKHANNFFQDCLIKNTGEKAREYLEYRKINKYAIDNFSLGYAPNNGLLEYLINKDFEYNTLLKAGIIYKNQKSEFVASFKNRLMFPIHNVKGDIVGFGARLIDSAKKNEPKYINSCESEIFQKKINLYGLFQNKQQLRHDLIIVEGYLDVIKLYQEGISGIAPLGTALSIEQFFTIWKYNNTPYLIFDGDSAGQKASYESVKKAIVHLNSKQRLKIINLQNNHDPDSYINDFGKLNFLKLLDTALKPYDLIWNETTKTFNLNNLSPEDVVEIKSAITDIISNIKDNFVKETYTKAYNYKLETLLKNKKQSKVKSISYKINIEKQLKDDELEEILLLCMLNNQELIDEMFETISSINCKNQNLNILKQEIIDIRFKENILENFVNYILNIKLEEDAINSQDYENLIINNFIADKNTIIGYDFFKKIFDLLKKQPHLIRIAPFIKANIDKQESQTAFKEICNKLYKKQTLSVSMQKITNNLEQDFDYEAWEKLKATKVQV